MVLSQRERQIVIIVGAIVAIFVLWSGLISPYLSARSDIADGLETAELNLKKDREMLTEQTRMKKIYDEMVKGGLGSDVSDAETELRNRVAEWAQDCDVNITSLKPDRTISEGKFMKVGFHLSGTGPQATLANFLWRIENTNMPLRIGEVQISPLKEGIDDLQFTLIVSTIARVADGERGARTLTADAGGR